jgi:hypothetical protein
MVETSIPLSPAVEDRSVSKSGYSDAEIKALAKAEVDKHLAKPDKITTEYLQKKANILSWDEMCALTEVYKLDPLRSYPELPRLNTIVWQLFDKQIDDPKFNAVYMFGGAAGSGKSSLLDALLKMNTEMGAALKSQTGLFFDRTFSSQEDVNKVIDAAVKAGKKIHLVNVNMNMNKALKLIISRAIKTQRAVSVRDFVKMKVRTYKSMLGTLDKHRSKPIPNFNFHVIENDGDNVFDATYYQGEQQFETSLHESMKAEGVMNIDQAKDEETMTEKALALYLQIRADLEIDVGGQLDKKFLAARTN